MTSRAGDMPVVVYLEWNVPRPNAPTGGGEGAIAPTGNFL